MNKPISDTAQSLLSEARKLERAVKQRKAALAKLEAAAPATDTLYKRRPRRYSVEFDFEPGVLQAQTSSFAVDGGTVFRVDRIETSFRIVGQAEVYDDAVPALVAGQPASVTLPYGINLASRGSLVYRQWFFDFFWQIRDNGQDREFQNVKQPSVFLLSGPLAGMNLPIPGYLVGGSDVATTIDPVNSIVPDSVSDGLGSFFNVSSYRLHVSFFGFEVTQ